jgi:hypothetical protein
MHFNKLSLIYLNIRRTRLVEVLRLFRQYRTWRALQFNLLICMIVYVPMAEPHNGHDQSTLAD